jgi:hypothetical protein
MATEEKLTFINFVIIEHQMMQNLKMLTYIRHDFPFKAQSVLVLYTTYFTFCISPTESTHVFYISLRKTVIISLNSIKELVFLFYIQLVFLEVGTVFLNVV